MQREKIEEVYRKEKDFLTGENTLLSTYFHFFFFFLQLSYKFLFYILVSNILFYICICTTSLIGWLAACLQVLLIVTYSVYSFFISPSHIPPLPYLTLSYLILTKLILPYLTLIYFSYYLALPYLTLPDLTLPYSKKRRSGQTIKNNAREVPRKNDRFLWT